MSFLTQILKATLYFWKIRAEELMILKKNQVTVLDRFTQIHVNIIQGCGKMV